MTILRMLSGRAIGAAAILMGLSVGSALGGTISITNYTLPNGYTQVQISDGSIQIDGSDPTNVSAGTIALQTSIGALNTYCVDIFDYINQNTTYSNVNQATLGTGSQYSNGTSTVNFTKTQVNLIGALLANGGMPANETDTTALQVAIWEVEYGTAASNGTYSLSTGNFTITADSAANPQSANTVAEAQTYLNDATGYASGSNFVAATWGMTANQFVVYLTSPGMQGQVYLATPEPSTIAVLSVGLLGLWAARRRKRI